MAGSKKKTENTNPLPPTNPLVPGAPAGVGAPPPTGNERANGDAAGQTAKAQSAEEQANAAAAAAQSTLANSQAAAAKARQTQQSAANAKATAMADWYTNVAPKIIQGQNDLSTAQSADNSAAVGPGGSTAGGFEADLVTDGGFTPAQASQLEAIWNADYDNPDKSPSQIYIDLINSAPVKERYPAISMMQAKGIAPVTISQYQQLESDMAALHKAAGLPDGTYSVNDLTQALVNNIPITGGPDSIEGRIQAATTWAQSQIKANPDAWGDLQKWYGVTPGSLAAYALTNNEGVLQNQLTSTQIGAGLQGQGFTQIDKNQMLNLAATGVTQSQADNASAGAIGGAQNAGADVGLTGAQGAKLSGVSFSQGELVSATLGGKVFANGQATGESQGQATIQGRRAVSGAAAKFQTGGTYGTGTSSAAGSASE
jgi:hypothetical protein